MSHDTLPAYGLWPLALMNAMIFIIFAFSFGKPQTRRDWRTFGAFSGFIVALFAEMYGFPLTIYLLSGWLQRAYPGLDPFSHDAGHLWWTLFGLQGNPHFGALHLASNVLILGGFVLLSASWRILFEAQKRGRVATTGPYAYVRHPQYVAFAVIIFAFLLQWPTLLTLAMFPVLLAMYIQLAKSEEREAIALFGDEYRRYTIRVPAFLPRLSRQPEATAS
jgi:protein-S-isoprenylcysteine O-methyltransferase Ste14